MDKKLAKPSNRAEDTDNMQGVRCYLTVIFLCFMFLFSLVCQIMLCMLNLLTHLKQDWINSGVTRKLFMIIMLKFKGPEAEV